jgi:tRNA A37 threonylcarbamoyladenosine modification protein TsaB
LIGISTLEVTAEPFRALAPQAAAVVAAGRGRVIWQFIPGSESPVNGIVEELANVIAAQHGEVLVVGDLDTAQAERLRALSNAVVPDAALRQRRPGVLAELGWTRLATGDIDDPIALAPVYVHTGPAAIRG